MKLYLTKLVLAATLVSLIMAASGYTWVQHQLDKPIDLNVANSSLDEERLLWTVEKGSNLNRVISQLHKRKIISYPVAINIYAKLTNRTSIKAGDYWISNADTPRTLLNKFNQGLVVTYKITFPEGWTFAQWINHLSQIVQFAEIKSMATADIINMLDIQINHPEGWFFPDTYTYSATDSATDILLQAHLRMREVLDQAWQSREPNLPYKTAYEALIMASIIEKETGVAEEREEIAGVFVRRLQLGMRLQTDPTVIYGMGDRYNGNITRRDLKQITPYNTYRINGLPPTPIAMPGQAAIAAAVNPLPGTSLYFVARGDGSHQFSDTNEEHQKAVRYYQIKKRVKNYQSLPPQK